MTNRTVGRRQFIKAAGAGGVSVLAGCSAADAGGSADTLVVATYPSFIDAPSSSPGEWVETAFEAEFDTNLVFQTPESGLDHYIQRANAGAEIDADVYVGLNVDSLIRLDANLEGDELLSGAPSLENEENIKEPLRFDPDGRAVPYDTGYISLVWNATADDGEFIAPESFDGLLDSAYKGDLLAQNPATSATGRAFLLHTINEYGPDGYLDYWAGLQENDVRILGSWDDAYGAYGEDEAPMVVSYSTDQVYANRYGQNMDRHQLRFLNDQGYANPEGMARFASSEKETLANSFMAFLLRPEVQGQIAARNVQFPAVTNPIFPEEYPEYETYAVEPPEAVSFSYQELQGNLQGWIEDWERQIVGN
ncbi:thiamine ABC transporter substrate binding subunit [Halolamina sp.]|jgi:thiamine transport system substrate-binding protein|uniref:thiamine ABC transporter substrate-binding protein n=1 Tax=Halolamina sp. TaxID=1940283 RepID=UPI000223BA36|nr:ABC transporter, periplasmic binding protein, thiB subfamily [halophilic archaeon DL31]